MRIIHVSNFGYKHNGRLFWNHCYKISNGLTRNGHSVYNFSDRDVARSSLLRIFNKNLVNVKLIELCKNFNPDLIILGHADKVSIDTLGEIKSLNKEIKIIEWNIDNYFLDNTEDKLKKRSHMIDGFFMHNANEQISSCLDENFIAFFPNIFDLSIERLKIFNFKNHKNNLFSAVSHGVGTGTLRKKNTLNESNNKRVKTLEYLKKNCLMDINFDFYGINNIQPVWASEFENKISDSYMGLCLQREPFLKYGISDRFAQYQGNGLMTLIPSQLHLQDLFVPNKEAVFFSSNSELKELVNYYSSNKEKALKIAKCGWERGHSDYNERIITKYFIDLTFNNNTNITWPEIVYR